MCAACQYPAACIIINNLHLDMQAIKAWISRCDTSPMTGLRLSSTDVVPNLVLKSAIRDWEESQAKARARR
jgi:hypothetical protein